MDQEERPGVEPVRQPVSLPAAPRGRVALENGPTRTLSAGAALWLKRLVVAGACVGAVALGAGSAAVTGRLSRPKPSGRRMTLSDLERALSRAARASLPGPAGDSAAARGATPPGM
jgi:hypothetical protein